MSDRPSAQSTEGPIDTLLDSAVARQGLSPEALARRLMLVKTLGKGSALVAASAVPMHTLATQTSLVKTNLGKNNAPICRCGISGMMSGIGSRDPDAKVCSGYLRDRYKTLGNWPGCNAAKTLATFTVGSKTCKSSSSFSFVFGGGSTSYSLLTIIKNDRADECNWVAALLNAISAPESFNFPYSPTEVVALYQDKTRSTSALNFFKTYMETKS